MDLDDLIDDNSNITKNKPVVQVDEDPWGSDAASPVKSHTNSNQPNYAISKMADNDDGWDNCTSEAPPLRQNSDEFKYFKPEVTVKKFDEQDEFDDLCDDFLGSSMGKSSNSNLKA